jgi:hypothetical protein
MMRKNEYTSRGALWIRGSKAKPFKELFLSIAKNLGGMRKARAFIPLSGDTHDLLNHFELTSETGRRIIDANNRLKEIENKEALKKLTAILNQGNNKQ